MNDLVITRILDQVPGEILCEIADGTERSWARVSTTDWRILARGKRGTDRGRLGAASYSPDRNSVYAVFSTGGLVIFESESGESVRDFGRIGSFGNAPTQGVTFDPSGTLIQYSKGI